MSPPMDIDPSIAGVRALLYDTARLDENGIVGAAPGDIQGVIVEIGMDGSVVVIAGFADGASRLFLGRGGGVIGHPSDFPEKTRKSAQSLVKAGASCAKIAVPEVTRRWPGEGSVRFALLSRTGVTSFERKVVALANDTGAAGKAWVAANSLLEQLLVCLDTSDDDDTDA